MKLKMSGNPFPLVKSIILIFCVMSSAGFAKYKKENSKNSTLNSEYSKNRRICKNSKNNLTSEISKAMQGPSLSLQLTEHLLFKPDTSCS